MSTMTRKSGTTGQQAESRAARDGVTTAVSGEMTREQVQARAYQIYENRRNNGNPGDAKSDWLQAERELNGSAPDPTASSDIEIKAQARGERLLVSGGK